MLNVPAEKDRAAFNNNVGYTMADFEAEVAKPDPSTFQKFQKRHCNNTIAKRVDLICGLLNGTKGKPAKISEIGLKKENQANQKAAKSEKRPTMCLERFPRQL